MSMPFLQQGEGFCGLAEQRANFAQKLAASMPKRCILDSETEEDSHVGFELLYRGFFQQDFRSLLSDLVRIW